MTTSVLARTPLVRVQLVRDRQVSYLKHINAPDQLAAAARAVIGELDREAFMVLHLDHKHKLLSMETVAVGTISSVVVHPREVYKGALLASAAAIALAHVHPSGDPTPSEEDRVLTTRLLQAGEILGIRVLDHLVLGTDCFVSLRETTSLWQQQLFHA